MIFSNWNRFLHLIDSRRHMMSHHENMIFKFGLGNFPGSCPFTWPPRSRCPDHPGTIQRVFRAIPVLMFNSSHRETSSIAKYKSSASLLTHRNVVKKKSVQPLKGQLLRSMGHMVANEQRRRRRHRTNATKKFAQLNVVLFPNEMRWNGRWTETTSQLVKKH